MMIQHAFRSHPELGPWCLRCRGPRSLHRTRKREYHENSIKPRDRIIGIDGEGKGRRPHRYTYMAAVDEFGKQWSIRNEWGLPTIDAFEFMLSLPSRALVFFFAGLYDLTKICKDIDDDNLYSLFHERTRMRIIDGREDYAPIHWEGYRVNFVNRRFTLAKDTRRTVAWDIFRFFATKFTGALLAWQISTKEKLERMERMKALRSEFDKQSNEEIEGYCNEECSYLASLGRKLIVAHDTAKLPLTQFYGAGSTASAFLKRIDVKKRRGQIPVGMRIPVACAFFGGRFENARIGPIRQRTYDYDISSAYPYQATRLPCLSCGQWEYSQSLASHSGRIGVLTLVRWRSTNRESRPWGTLPVRLPKGWRGLSKGTIVFPLSAREGWTWWEEFEAARALDPSIEAVESWSYYTDCDHKPFADIPGVYRERLKLGKDAQGLVLKLGLNSIYGKLAQSVGLHPPYQSFVWAGNITSGCRAQLLRLMSQATDMWNILAVATDGIKSLERLTVPKPIDTGTSDLPKPLGGWEEKVLEKGVFCVRPGIYFPLEPTEEEIEAVRARGLGRRVVYEQWQRIVAAWERGAREVNLGGVQRFIGAKTGFSIRKGRVVRRCSYGEWVMQTIKCSFSSRPKRSGRNGDRLIPWRHVDVESIPYDRAMSDDGLMMAMAETIAEEQPDVDYSDLA